MALERRARWDIPMLMAVSTDSDSYLESASEFARPIFACLIYVTWLCSVTRQVWWTVTNLMGYVPEEDGENHENIRVVHIRGNMRTKYLTNTVLER
jgi:hypothetical protein